MSLLPNPLITLDLACDSNAALPSLITTPNPFIVENTIDERDWRCNTNTIYGLQATDAIIDTTLTKDDLLLDAPNATGFTLEFWMSPGDITSETGVPLMGLFSDFADDFFGCSGYSWLVLQDGPHLEFRYVDDNYGNSCRRIVARQEELVSTFDDADESHTPSLYQVVMVLGHGQTSIWYNGRPLFQGAPNFFFNEVGQGWPETDHLQVFGTYLFRQSPFFDGTLRQVQLDNQAWTEDQIQASYQHGLNQHQEQQDRLQQVIWDSIVLQALETQQDLMVLQGSPYTLDIGGFNASDSQYEIQVEVLHAPTFGRLLWGDDGSMDNVLAPGQKVSLPSDRATVSATYEAPNDDYFNVPSSTFVGQELDLPSIDHVVYRLVAMDRRRRDVGIVAASDEVKQAFPVVHVNHRPTLKVADDQVQVDPDQQPTGIHARPLATMPSIELNDSRDQDMDRVRVTVWASHGTLSLPDEMLGMTDFASCQDRLASSASSVWDCHGTGRNDQNMTFLALPSSLTEILSGMVYWGFAFDHEDTIEIRVLDGAGGDCLSQQEHASQRSFRSEQGFFAQYSTAHLDCFVQSASLQVPSIPRADGDSVFDDETGQSFLRALFDFENFGLADAIFWGFVLFVIIFCVMCCRCFCNCCRHCRSRGSKVGAADNNDNSVQPSYGTQFYENRTIPPNMFEEEEATV